MAYGVANQRIKPQDIPLGKLTVLMLLGLTAVIVAVALMRMIK